MIAAVNPADLLERDTNELGFRAAACLLGEHLATYDVIERRCAYAIGRSFAFQIWRRPL